MNIPNDHTGLQGWSFFCHCCGVIMTQNGPAESPAEAACAAPLRLLCPMLAQMSRPLTHTFLPGRLCEHRDVRCADQW